MVIRSLDVLPVLRLTFLTLGLATVLSGVSGCGGYTGSWPKLGPTAQEAGQSIAPENSVRADPQRLVANTSDDVATRDIRTRLAQATSAYAEVERRLTLQVRSVNAAVSKVGDRSDSSWSLAQLELSRLNQIETEMKGVRSDAAAIAADLAGFSARGIDVRQIVADTGALINAIDLSLEQTGTRRDQARGRLSS